MLDKFRQQLRERRGGYSFRGHLARLKREGRLPRAAGGILAAVIVAGVAFGRCESSSITGPDESAADYAARTTSLTGGSVVPDPDPDRFTFEEKLVQRNVVFTGVNPCNGDAVRLEGTRYEKIRISAGVGYFDSHHHIRDWCLRGYAINDRRQKYEATDEHEHHLKITTAGLDEETETQEYLKALGSEPDWRLKVYQRYRVRYEDPLNIKVAFRAKASCDHECALPGGCIEREFTLVTADEFPITELPESP